MNVQETIKKVLTNHGVDVSGLTPDQELSVVGLDSLDFVEIVMDVEDELGIRFATTELGNIKTLNDFVTMASEKIAK